MTGQLLLARAQFLVKRILALRSTSHDNAMAMTPTHTNSSLARGNQQDPIHTLGHIARNAFCDFSIPVLLLAPDAQLFERVGGPQVKGTGGSSCVYSRPTGGRPGGEIRKLHSGMGGQRWKGDSKIALSSSESTS
jgi:hypothetical protein